MVVSYDFAVLVGLFTAAAAFTDWRVHKIPNYLTVPAAVLGVAYHTLMPSSELGLLWSVVGFFIGFGLLLLPWLLGGGGMGDVKLLAALGAWLGPKLLLFSFAGSVFFAAIMALSMLIYSALTAGVIKTKKDFLVPPSDAKDTKKKKPKKRAVPFAVPVAVSTWLLLAWRLVANLTQ
jgi:prepilin peptidase CpaA